MHERTTIVEIFGRVDVHPWIRIDSLGEDAYSLFMARSTCLNWFEVVDPRATRTVTARLKPAPEAPDIDAAALLDALRRRNTGPFRFGRGDGRDLTVTMPEWSVAAAAWATSMLAHESALFVTDGPPAASVEVLAEPPRSPAPG